MFHIFRITLVAGMRLAALLLVAAAAFAANQRLYLKDGSYHVVTEYKVDGDRVNYYSAERSEWEAIPLALVDLPKTEAEQKAHSERLAKDAAEQSAEDEAERAIENEILRVPPEPGVYLVEKDALRTIPVGEVKIVTDKKRSILKAVTPVPIITGKATVEMDGEKSSNVITDKRPEFYLRQAANERMAIVRMGAKKGVRVVEKLSIVPVVNEAMEEQDQVEIFRRQFAEGLFKIWPTADLPPGEYAVVQYTQGKLAIQAWDFRVE